MSLVSFSITYPLFPITYFTLNGLFFWGILHTFAQTIFRICMDSTLQFVPIMIVGFVASLGLTPVSRQIAMRLGVVAVPNKRNIHKGHMPLMGGMAIYVAFVASATGMSL